MFTTSQQPFSCAPKIIEVPQSLAHLLRFGQWAFNIDMKPMERLCFEARATILHGDDFENETLRVHAHVNHFSAKLDVTDGSPFIALGLPNSFNSVTHAFHLSLDQALVITPSCRVPDPYVIWLRPHHNSVIQYHQIKQP